MPETRLTQRKQLFVARYLELGEAAGAARAAGYSERRARQSGWRLLQDPKIKALVDAGRADLAKRSEITQDKMIERFEILRDKAIAEKQLSAAVKAEEAVARMLGFIDSKSAAVAGVKIEIVRYGEQPLQIDARAA